MPLDPPLQGMLTVLAQHGGGQLSAGTVEQSRKNLRLITVDLRPPEAKLPVRSVEEITLDTDVVTLPGRVYRPETEGPVPTVVFFHGGGFVLGDLDTHDDTCRRLCRDVEAVVVSVGYRLGPESRWPAAPEDAVAATLWVAERLAEFGGDDRLAVGGDSAGGNLSAVVTQRLRDVGGPAITAQLLAYPVVDFSPTGDYPSRAEAAQGYFLTLEDMLWFGMNYLPEGSDENSPVLADPRLSPLKGELAGLPPAVVITAEFDPLRDEGEAYADALQAAGVDVLRYRFDGVIHGFLDLGLISPACEAATQTSYAAFRKLLWS
jgi:acetyl esterase